jgi:hypothetical protein
MLILSSYWNKKLYSIKQDEGPDMQDCIAGNIIKECSVMKATQP